MNLSKRSYGTVYRAPLYVNSYHVTDEEISDVAFDLKVSKYLAHKCSSTRHSLSLQIDLTLECTILYVIVALNNMMLIIHWCELLSIFYHSNQNTCDYISLLFWLVL